MSTCFLLTSALNLLASQIIVSRSGGFYLQLLFCNLVIIFQCLDIFTLCRHLGGIESALDGCSSARRALQVTPTLRPLGVLSSLLHPLIKDKWLREVGLNFLVSSVSMTAASSRARLGLGGSG